LLVPVVALFGATMTAFDASYLLFARHYAARLEADLNAAVGDGTLLAAQIEATYLFPLNERKVVVVAFGSGFTWFGFMTLFITAFGVAAFYDLTDNDPPDSPPSLNLSSDIVRAINCLSTSSTGTNLGDPMAAAGAYLVANGRPDVPNGIVFMTDGEANQPYGSNSVNCDYAKTKATQVKQSGVVVVTIAYRLQGVNCGSDLATAVLADMASDPQNASPTSDDGGDGPGGLPGGCNTAASIDSENADGDHFLCAPDPSQLSEIFIAASKTILAEFSVRTVLIRPPS